jgi:DNA-binding SARP family transcriptional activator/tetratricopeptide (TPR) repeat protein
MDDTHLSCDHRRLTHMGFRWDGEAGRGDAVTGSDGPVFELLGPVRARCGERSIGLGVRKRRFVLAVLALEVGQLVTVDRLVDLLWPDTPPVSARGIVRGHVSGLRSALAKVRAQEHAVALRRQGPGYVLRCDPGRVDVHRFAELTAAAAAAGDDERRLALLDSALALWRGPALTDAAAEPVRGMLAGHLDEARLVAVEDRLDALLRLRRDHGTIEQLTRLTAEHPSRQRLVGMLMVALHRAGRTAEALRAYRDTRRQLADDVGLDPSAALQRLELAILRDEVDLVGPPRTASPVPLAAPPGQAEQPVVAHTGPATAPLLRPAQLPGDVATFTGRADELAALLGALPPADARTASSAVIVIDGMAGVGKTVLAVHACHLMRGRFPDGQLFLDLHGFTSGGQPTEPADALDRLLLALGVPGARIPPGAEDRAALYRTVLTDRRALILLDNAATEAQVRPLVPAAPGCLALVTSRQRLIGLDNAVQLSLDALPSAEAVHLFSQVAGQERLAGEPPGLVEQVVELCGRLPLAVRLAAARLRSRPAWTVAYLIERLGDERCRLTELKTSRHSVAGAFHLSYLQLDADQQRLFRRLGLHPGADLDSYAAAALAGAAHRSADRLLEDLLDGHLVQQDRPGRYHLHDLLRAYAARLCVDEDTVADCRAALNRLLDWYVHTAAAATRVTYPHEANPPLVGGAVVAGDFATRERAEAWLDSELDNLLAAANHAADSAGTESPRAAVHLSAILHRHLRTRGRYSEAAILHRRAAEIAAGMTDHRGEAAALNRLGDVYRMLGQYGPATDCHERALRSADDLGDIAVGLTALIGLGRLHRTQGRYGPANDALHRALDLARAAGDRTSQLNVLTGLGHIQLLQGNPDQAIDSYRRALELARATANHGGECAALSGLGHAHRLRDEPAPATDSYEQALRIARTTGNRTGELGALVGRGNVRLGRGEPGLAADDYRAALTVAEATSDRNGQFEALHGLGRACHAIHRYEQALRHHEQALDLAIDLNQPPDQARAHDGVAHSQNALGRPDKARQHWRHALDILYDLGAPRADEVTAADLRVRLRPVP